MPFVTENIDIRRARRSDLESIVAILAHDPLGSTRENPNLPLIPEYISAFESINADENQFLAVAETSAQLVGTLQLTFIPGISRMGSWRGQIEGVRVAAGYRDLGIGEKLFRWGIEQCKRNGCQLVQLTTDKTRKDAHRFYEKLGFSASHDGYKLLL